LQNQLVLTLWWVRQNPISCTNPNHTYSISVTCNKAQWYPVITISTLFGPTEKYRFTSSYVCL